MEEYTRDTDGTFLSLKVNGKAVGKSKLNALNKAIKTSYWRLYPDGDYTIRSIFSSAEVSALAYSIYQWTEIWQRKYSNGGFGIKVTVKCETPIATFDNMRYLVNDFDSTITMN